MDVVIIQETEKSLIELKEILSDKFNVVYEGTNGQDGLTHINTFKPQIVITGLVTQGIDGLQVIQEIKRNHKDTKIVVLSGITHEEIIQKAIELGADAYFTKPVDSNLLINKLYDLLLTKNDTLIKKDKSVDEKISKMFISLGIPPHIKGYVFLREGVKMTIETPSIINSITKKLYPQISEKYSTTPSKVERAIRHAIEVAWNRNRIDSINSIFGVRAYINSEKPTNGEFIALVADKLLLECE